MRRLNWQFMLGLVLLLAGLVDVGLIVSGQSDHSYWWAALVIMVGLGNITIEGLKVAFLFAGAVKLVTYDWVLGRHISV